jgi:iron complex outermembrane receptor protein
MITSRFALCALAGAVTLALQGAAFAEESTIVVTGSAQGDVLPVWTNSATKSAVAESKTRKSSIPSLHKRLNNVMRTR